MFAALPPSSSDTFLAFPAAAVVRPSIVFGIEDDFLNRFAWIARLAPAIPLIGGGNTRFQPVYVGDVAAGIMRIVEDPGTSGVVYEFGGPTVYSFKDLMEAMLEQIGRRRLLLPVPGILAMLPARLMELSPFPPLLTRDQIRMLACDNVAAGDAPGLAELGLPPTPLEAVAPGYLARYRRGGRPADR